MRKYSQISAPMHFFLAFLFAASTSALQSYPSTVHEKRAHHPSLIQARRLEGHVTVPLKIGLKQRNIDNIAEYLVSVSDPQSPSFAQHWSPDKVADFFAPANETAVAVSAWLAEAGFAEDRIRMAHNKAWIHVDNTTVDEVEQLLGAEYHVYIHESGEEHVGKLRSRRDNSDPAHEVFASVRLVLPAGPHCAPHRNYHTHCAAEHKAQSFREAREDHTYIAAREQEQTNGGSYSPCRLRSGLHSGLHSGAVQYDLRPTGHGSKQLWCRYVGSAVFKNSVLKIFAVSQAPDTYLQSDLDVFFANYSPSLVGSSPLFVSIDGGEYSTSTRPGSCISFVKQA